MHKLGVFISMLLLTCSSLANQCGNFAAISKDGRFMLFDSKSLAITDIGDMRYLGIYDLDEFISGSDIYFPITHLDHHKNLDENRNHSGGAITILPAFAGTQHRSPNLTFIVPTETERYTRLLDTSLLLGVETQHNDVVTKVYDRQGSILNQHILPVVPLNHHSFCQSQSTIYYAGKKQIANIQARKVSVKDYPFDTGIESFFRAQHNCLILLLQKSDPEQALSTYRLIDMVKNQIIGQFVGNKDAVSFIAPWQNTIVQQLLNPPSKKQRGQTTYVTQEQPTASFQRLDMVSGTLIKAVTLERPRGLAKKLVCGAVQPALVIQDKNSIHLLDVNTMTVTHSIRVPFKRFFIL